MWGQGYGRAYTTDEIYEIYDNRDDEPFAGYGPLMKQRIANQCGHVILPEGCDAFGTERQAKDPSEVDPGRATSQTDLWSVAHGVRAWMVRRGWDIDQHGRGLHPHWDQLQSCNIWLNTGPGIGYYYGEQVVADAVVTDGSRVVLIKRPVRTSPNDAFPALPGGYALPGDFGKTASQWLAGNRPVTIDGIIRTALRKFEEETGIELSLDDFEAQIVRAIRPVSSAHTLNFWTVTYTVRIRVNSLDRFGGHGDAYATEVGDVAALEPKMWPDHFRALQAALTF
jgi:8-oxo-dGTP pyrophosphatase MutT (NUDIX family)